MPGHETPQLAPAGATPARCRPHFPSRNRRFPDRCRSPDCASTAFRCRRLLLRQKLFVLPCRRLRNNYILCPTGTPTFAAARRQRRDLIIANPGWGFPKGRARTPFPFGRFKGKRHPAPGRGTPLPPCEAAKTHLAGNVTVSNKKNRHRRVSVKQLILRMA